MKEPEPQGSEPEQTGPLTAGEPRAAGLRVTKKVVVEPTC